MVKARKYVYVSKRFDDVEFLPPPVPKPKVSDYQLVEQELPALKNGEILVKTEFISVDPYLQFIKSTESYPHEQPGYQVGVVLESKNAQFLPGTHVVSHKGWTDHYIANPDVPVKVERDRITKVPDLKGLPISYAIGTIGMPGASAYLCLLEVTRPKPGETVVVTGAAGAVGSIAGQIAKIKGCRVIGFAGSDDKVRWLEKELGFDKAFNYKTVDIATALKEAAPNGVDAYFDNVGGEISSIIIGQMNLNGRVGVIGSISAYNDVVLPKVTILQPAILSNQLEIKGFGVFNRSAEKWAKAFEDLTNWIKSGQIKVREHVVEGFDKVPEVFIGMLAGDSFGKAVVKV